MGNYKFRFSDMIPNAWFHKLKNMNNKPTPNYTKTLSHSKKKYPSLHSPEFTNSDQRKSYYFTRDLTLVQPESPPKPAATGPQRKLLRRRRSTKRSRRPPPPPRPTTASCNCAAAESVNDSSTTQECTNSGRDQSSSSEPDSVLTEYGSDRDSGHDTSMVSWASPCKCGAANDVIVDIDNSGCGKEKWGDGEDQDQCLRRRLPPIITKKNEATEKAENVVAGSPVRRLPPAKTPGVKLRVISPRIVNPRRAAQGRRSVSSNSSSAASSRRSISESFAVVKASKDPRRDFRESMVEMILENNIRASNDLEELLACYLSLNSDEYHDLIINVFKQIWFDFTHLRLN